jgi:hypothetical protein
MPANNSYFVHVSQFGVVPGTASDQRANVQNALDYAASLHPFGCTILFDAVDYRWDTPVIIKGHGTKLHFRNATIKYYGTGRAFDFGIVGGTSMPVECLMSEVNIDLTSAVTPCDGVRWAASYSKAHKVNVLIPASFNAGDAGIELYNAGTGTINGPYYNEFEGCSIDSQSSATKHFGFRFAMNAPNYMGCNANTFINNRVSGCLVGFRVNGTGCSFLGNNVETPAGTGTAYHFDALAAGQCGGNIVCGGYIEGAAVAFKFAALALGNFITPPYGTGIGTWIDDATPDKRNGVLSSNIPTILPTGVKIRGLSADPEVLDYYGESTFTPTITFTTPGDLSVTYGPNNGGRYTRVGNRVFFDLYLQVTALTFTTASGALMIGGLPFTSAPTIPAQGSIGYIEGLSYAGRTQVVPQCAPTTTNMYLGLHGSGLGTVSATASNTTSGTPLLLQISGSYSV